MFIYPTNLIKPYNTLEDLDEIMDDNTINKKEKKKSFSNICKRNGIKPENSCNTAYQNLIDNLEKGD